jgi:hypothetical protein
MLIHDAVCAGLAEAHGRPGRSQASWKRTWRGIFGWQPLVYHAPVYKYSVDLYVWPVCDAKDSSCRIAFQENRTGERPPHHKFLFIFIRFVIARCENTVYTLRDGTLHMAQGNTRRGSS